MTTCTPAPRRSGPARRHALTSRPAASGLLGLALLAACANLILTRDPGDLDVYRAGGQAVLSGRSLYGFRLHGLGFTYPPLAALLFTALARLPRFVAVTALSVATLSALVALVRRIASSWWNSLAGRPSVWATTGMAALIASEPVRSTLRFGQIDVLLTALVVLDLTSRRTARYRGAVVGVAAAIKLTPGIFVVYLLLRRRYRDAANAIVAFVLVTSAALLVLPGDSVRFWTHELADDTGVGNFASLNNNSLYGMLVRSFGSGAAGRWWPPLAVLCCAVGLFLAVRASRAGAEVLALGAVGVTGCVVSPIAWDHLWIWCIPLVVGAVSATRSARWALRAGVLCAGAVFVARDLVPESLYAGSGTARFVVVNAFVLTSFCIAGFCIASFCLADLRRRRSGASCGRSAPTRPACSSGCGARRPPRPVS